MVRTVQQTTLGRFIENLGPKLTYHNLILNSLTIFQQVCYSLALQLPFPKTQYTIRTFDHARKLIFEQLKIEHITIFERHIIKKEIRNVFLPFRSQRDVFEGGKTILSLDQLCSEVKKNR